MQAIQSTFPPTLLCASSGVFAMIIPGYDISSRVRIRPYSKRRTGAFKLVAPGHAYDDKKFTLSWGESFAGYDLRLSSVLVDPLADLEANQLEEPFVLCPQSVGGGFVLGSAVEFIEMPDDVVGVVHDKSTLARLGLAVQNTVIEPGWRGYLTLEITNHGPYCLQLYKGMPICQVLFYQIDGRVEGYNGKYQDQPSEPIKAK